MEDIDYLKYLGGFFDADGSIFWLSQGKICMNFSQSEKSVLDKINERYNFLFRESSRKDNKPVSCSSNRTQFALTKTGIALYPVLLDLKKTCIIKNPQICLALEFLNYMNRPGLSEKRNEIGRKIKDMNKEHYSIEYIQQRPYDKISIQYIAGLFDGDGCVTISKKGGRYAKITQKNDTLMLKKIHELYKGSRYSDGDYAVIFEKREVIEKFLEDVYPYLIYKKEQVDNFLRYVASDDETEKKMLYNKVKEAKMFDMDPDKYKRELEMIYEDLDKNYTKNDLMMGKKLQELKHVRNQKNWDNDILAFSENISPKLIFCETPDDNKKWLYFRKRTSSIYHNGTIGRNIRILVQDAISGKYIGVMAIGSDFYNITARDDYIKKFTDKTIPEYLKNIANLNCCVPLQPFGYNCNGGKLLVKMAFSREVSEYWMKKYNEPLLAISTMGVNGKSIMYDRLQEFKMIGYTKGECSTIHLPTEVIEKSLLLYKHLQLSIRRFGTVDMLKTLFRHVKMKTKYQEHINKKSVYFGWCYPTKFDSDTPDISYLKNVSDLTQEWKIRWCNKRIENLRKEKKLRFVPELYDANDDIFKNIKIYSLPEVKFPKIEKVLEKFIKQEKEPGLKIFDKLSDEMLINIITLKGSMTTEQASNNFFEQFNIRVPRNEISNLWLGNILPRDQVLNSSEYKKAMTIDKKRVYSKPKTEAWRNAIKNRTPSIDDATLLELMNHKKTKISAEECSKLFSYTSGKKIGEKLNRTAIQNIWSGKVIPTIVTSEYQEFLDYVKTRHR